MNHPQMLIVDDDGVFCQVLAQAMRGRGFQVQIAHEVGAALEKAQACVPQYAVVDLKMPGLSGLHLVAQLKALNADIRVVVLTGYASIATAVEAVKLGATHYLSKPADVDEILLALHEPTGNVELPVGQISSVKRLEWEHIQRVLSECEGNISKAARRLNMHRRTLQRKLAKRPVKF